tara:strand:- start:300 stop:752 length:453 start_codon:yes stop_codon:yes gene_type:complete
MINLTQEERWMLYSLKEAEKALKIEEVPIGAILVKNDKIIGRGFNQIESLNDSTAHAEIIAITSASNSIGDWRLNDCSMFVTKEPCLMCMGALINARVKYLYYGMPDLEYGFIQFTDKFKIKMPHLKKIEGKILEQDCKKIIQDFFSKKR